MAPKPIIRPGPTADGPPGWEERQQERLTSSSTQASGGSVSGHGRQPSDSKGVPETGDEPDAGLQNTDADRGKPMGKFKSKLHRLGEKMAFVPPRNAEAGSSTQVSTVARLSSWHIFWPY